MEENSSSATKCVDSKVLNNWKAANNFQKWLEQELFKLKCPSKDDDCRLRGGGEIVIPLSLAVLTLSQITVLWCPHEEQLYGVLEWSQVLSFSGEEMQRDGLLASSSFCNGCLLSLLWKSYSTGFQGHNLYWGG